jgi:hypothetical protein
MGDLGDHSTPGSFEWGWEQDSCGRKKGKPIAK